MILPAILFSAFVLAVPPAAAEVNLESLLGAMSDLDLLAHQPAPPYTCRQFSSYDPASKSPTEDWFANGDAGHFIREETNGGRKEWVMMDADGPGAIVRIWSANPAGVLRIYLDANPVPAIEAPMTDLLGGKVEFAPLPIAGERSRGWNSYLPIPYAKHCKVTSDAGGFYYHVNYRTYPAGTAVRTFTVEQARAALPSIKDLAKVLAAPRQRGRAAEQGAEAVRLDVAAGATQTVFSREGAGAITLLGFKELRSPDLDTALRCTILTISFDGEEAVRSPLGDFFGTAPGLRPFESLPLGVTAEGELWSHWVMPFARKAEVVLSNRGALPLRGEFRVAVQPRAVDDADLRFHAKWRVSRDLSTVPKSDWNMLETTGSGVFVGTAMYVANPVKQWWGEGDEKIYVDGEKFPSHFGTGTEDYFGYAWCCPELFTHAYHNQPRCDGPGNYGHTAVNRWHILDNIPFTGQFRFDIELWHWAECKVTLAGVSYWYARPGGKDNFPALRDADLPSPQIPPYVAKRVAGALEGEEFRVVEVAGNARPQEWGDILSGEKHLWWTDNKPGDRLVVEFPVEKAGRYQVLARFVSAADYGIVRLTVNKSACTDPVDLYNDSVAGTREIPLGTHDLAAGPNRLTIDVVARNEKSTNYMCGLDYLLLKPVE